MYFLHKSVTAAMLSMTISKVNAFWVLIALLGELKHLTSLFSVHLKQSCHFQYERLLWILFIFALFFPFNCSLVSLMVSKTISLVIFFFFFCLFRFRLKCLKPKHLFLICSKILATLVINQIRISIFLENFNGMDGMECISHFYFLDLIKGHSLRVI